MGLVYSSIYSEKENVVQASISEDTTQISSSSLYTSQNEDQNVIESVETQSSESVKPQLTETVEPQSTESVETQSTESVKPQSTESVESDKKKVIALIVLNNSEQYYVDWNKTSILLTLKTIKKEIEMEEISYETRTWWMEKTNKLNQFNVLDENDDLVYKTFFMGQQRNDVFSYEQVFHTIEVYRLEHFDLTGKSL